MFCANATLDAPSCYGLLRISKWKIETLHRVRAGMDRSSKRIAPHIKKDCTMEAST